MSDAPAPNAAGNFIRDLILADNASGRYQGRVATRFPPEPNGYLHVGHAKAMAIDFGLARDFGGTTNLRFDDTNPTTEDVEFVESIEADIRWLGFQWHGLHYASDYFEELYAIAVKLIEAGKAYVDSLSDEEIRDYRGDYYKKGRESPYRHRPIPESVDLFRRMRAGEFPDGAHVLRAKIDLTSQNMNLRDPILYRIRHAHHHRTGDTWCIYPMYDYAHPLSDAIEKITHSICTVEFEAHRPLYDWCIQQTGSYPSQQIEFARGNLTYCVMSKRKLKELVEKRLVSGWDDPRMPTLAGLRRRGYTPEAIRAFWERAGVSKAESVVDIGLLEYQVREDLNKRCARVMGVLRPLEVVIDNFPAGEVRELAAPLSPEDASLGSRTLHFSRVLYIDRDDFRDDPPKDWFRLAPGREVRLRYAGLIRCNEVERDATGAPLVLHCSIDEASWGGTSPDGRVVKGTLHWVSAAHALTVEARLYDRLFSTENPGSDEGKSFIDELNPASLVTLSDARVEPYLAHARPGERFQFERVGYFCVDPDSKPGRLVFNRTVGLRDSWAKIEAKSEPKKPAKAPKSAPAPSTAKSPPAPPAEIGIEEFQKVDLRVGIVREAGLIEGADKLLRLVIDLGEAKPRQIFAGLRKSYPDPSVLVGERLIVVANLKPRKMAFGISEGMVLAAGQKVLRAAPDAKPGDKVS